MKKNGLTPEAITIINKSFSYIEAVTLYLPPIIILGVLTTLFRPEPQDPALIQWSQRLEATVWCLTTTATIVGTAIIIISIRKIRKAKAKRTQL